MYIDLDDRIEAAGLTGKQRWVLRLLMAGYTVTDIAERARCSKASVSIHFKRALMQICRAHRKIPQPL